MKAKYNSLRTSLFFSALLLSIGTASAWEADRCSTRNAAGGWGFTVTGTNTTSYSVTGTNLFTTRDPDAIVGSGTVDANGNFTLKQTEVTNEQAVQETFTGKVTVNPDCTGTLTAPTYSVTATWAVVFVDNQREIRGILTSLVLPGGSSAPLPVQTLNAKRTFAGKS